MVRHQSGTGEALIRSSVSARVMGKDLGERGEFLEVKWAGKALIW